MLKQPGSQTPVHNVVMIRELCHANVIKQSKLLADVDVTLPRGDGSDHMTFQCFAERNANSWKRWTHLRQLH